MRSTCSRATSGDNVIVIPMAGLSRRFFDAGYDRPKFMLPLGDELAFDCAVRSFAAYFETRPFLFIARETGGIESFVRQRCDALGITDARIVMLDRETAGQAETVEQGITRAGTGPDMAITIFNIDTFRPGYREPPPERLAAHAGWLEVFQGSGANWSYVRPSDTGLRLAAETAEKRPISNLCCTGLYHFQRANDFLDALATERLRPQARELFVAPLYNHLIAKGLTVAYEEIRPDEVIFCGTPAEYEGLLRGAER